MGVGEDFRTFCSNFTVNNRESIGQMYQFSTRRLNLDFWDQDSKTNHSLYVGSYGRGTAILGFSYSVVGDPWEAERGDGFGQLFVLEYRS